MAKDQTEKSRYPSRYSPGQYVTAAQYIIELVCEQYARKQGKELPIHFWKLDEWRTYWGGQCRTVNQLIKKFPPSLLIKIIKEKKLDNVRPKWAQALFIKGMMEYKEVKEEKQKIDRPTEIILPKKNIKGGILDKLDEIDNE
jgi:hypothetical protein